MIVCERAGDPDIVIDCQHDRSWHPPPPYVARPRSAAVIAGHQAGVEGTWWAYGDHMEAPVWRTWPGMPRWPAAARPRRRSPSGAGAPRVLVAALTKARARSYSGRAGHRSMIEQTDASSKLWLSQAQFTADGSPGSLGPWAHGPTSRSGSRPA